MTYTGHKESKALNRVTANENINAFFNSVVLQIKASYQLYFQMLSNIPYHVLNIPRRIVKLPM
jgi:hypothetical protein